jgi:uncharacterized protein
MTPARFQALVRIAPFALFMLLLAVRGAVPETVAGWDTRWLYGVQVLLVGAILMLAWRHYDELHPDSAPTTTEWTLAVGVGLVVFVLWISLDAPWMTLGAWTGDSVGSAPGFVPVGADGQLLWELIVVRFIGAALLVPVMEEIFWRSFLMRWLQAGEPGDRGAASFDRVDARRVGLRAVALSTFVFMLAHTLWLAAIVAGLAYAWLYIRTGKLWVAVIAHAVTNGLLGAWVVATGRWSFW